MLQIFLILCVVAHNSTPYSGPGEFSPTPNLRLPFFHWAYHSDRLICKNSDTL